MLLWILKLVKKGDLRAWVCSLHRICCEKNRFWLWVSGLREGTVGEIGSRCYRVCRLVGSPAQAALWSIVARLSAALQDRCRPSAERIEAPLDLSAMTSLESEPRMDLAVQKIAISGPTLALIMQDFGSSPGDCDGVLFGHVVKVTSPNLQDDDDQSGFREELTAIVTGFYCSGRLFSFYDATGVIDYAKLAQLIGGREDRGGDPPIGWFVGRRNSPMRPSMRETAVTRCLRLAPSSTARDQYFPKGASGLSRVAASPSGGQNLRESRIPSRADGGEAFNPADGSSRVSRTSSQSSRASRDGLHSSPSSTVVRSGGISSPIEVESPGSDLAPKAKSRSSPQADKNNQAAITMSPSRDPLPASKFVGIPPSSPCLFLLFTESGAQQAVHTHDYRAYQYHLHPQGGVPFQPRTVGIVNIGPAFRVQYDSFSPVAPFPLLSNALEYSDKKEDESQSWSSTSESRINRRQEGSRKATSTLSKDQMLLDTYSEGFKLERLASLIGPDGMRRVPELEDLYSKMLSKLETLAKQVCECSAALTEQEKLNAQMRAAFMGME